MVDTEVGASASAASGGRRRSAGGAAWGFAKELLLVVVGAIIVSSLLRAFVGQMFIIPSGSMEHTLEIGDRVVVQKITSFERGDIVVFSDPGGWLDEEEQPVAHPGPLDRAFEFIGIPTKSTPGHLIKRVIGMPGDTVVCCDTEGRITVNGQALDETSYLYSDSDGQVEPSAVTFEVVVPADHVFVMGDHRDLSADSRCHLSDIDPTHEVAQGQLAFVPTRLIVGPAFAIAAPFDRATRLHRPATFADVPAPSQPAPAEGVIKPEGITC